MLSCTLSQCQCGSFRKLGVPYFGVLIIRILLFGYYIRVPYFRNLPCGTDMDEENGAERNSALGVPVELFPFCDLRFLIKRANTKKAAHVFPHYWGSWSMMSVSPTLIFLARRFLKHKP